MARTIKNDPSRAGELAARKILFGEFRRYAVAPIHTRFDAVSWFVWDAHVPDEECGGIPSVIRQADTKEEAMSGLE